MATRAEARQASRDKVLASARVLFQERGFSGTTVRDIAADAGVSVGTVMSVGDKGQLLVQIFDDAVESVHARRAEQKVPASNQASGPVQRILTLLSPFVRLFLEQRELAREYAAILMSGNHSSAIFEDLAQTLREEFAAELKSAGMNREDANSAAEVLHLSYLGSLFAWSAGPEITEEAALESLRPAFAFILNTCKA